LNKKIQFSLNKGKDSKLSAARKRILIAGFVEMFHGLTRKKDSRFGAKAD
tara:strand:- start:1697 stop:1846 length:150 start_codon:yes stop_codon:yes gene_type:complete